MPERQTKSRRGEVALFQLLPNALTLGAICAGVTAIRMAAFGSFDTAVALIILACVLDGVDGRMARALGSESPLGAELDSLADFVNFGVAPAMVLYFRALETAPQIGWLAALAYAMCCVLRLARFNVGVKSDNGGDKRFFTGVPSPAGALLALAPIFLLRAVPSLAPLPPMAVAVWLVLVGGLMISRIPTFSLKTTIYAEYTRLVLVGITAAVAALAIYPWMTLLLFDIGYLCAILASWRASRHPLTEAED
jgi:CDP-diacylglycerol--serine O-phosphatidyltransferase